MRFTADELARITGGTLFAAPDTVVTSVTTDSRRVAAGALFIAIAGEHVDGAAYATPAIDAGATLVLAERRVDAPCLVVGDVVVALADIARAHLATLPEVTVIGITGSSGKTSTKDLVAQVLAIAGPTVAPAGSMNNDIGLPLTVLTADAATRFLVLEMGMRGLGEIRRLCAIARPDIAVVLNIGTAHAGVIGSKQATAEGKGEIYEALTADGVGIVNLDDDFADTFTAKIPGSVRTFGLTAGDVHAMDLRLDDTARAAFTLCAGDERADVSLLLPGEHQVSNALAATAIALACGLQLEDIAAALSTATATSRWRMELTELPNGVTLVNDAYNANPESMRTALRALAVMGRQRRTWAVLGEMRELGEQAVEAHDAIGRLAVRLDISHLVAIGPMGKILQVAAMNEGSWGDEAVHVPDIESAIDYVLERWLPGDIVLVKASRSIGLERVADALIAAAARED